MALLIEGYGQQKRLSQNDRACCPKCTLNYHVIIVLVDLEWVFLCELSAFQEWTAAGGRFTTMVRWFWNNYHRTWKEVLKLRPQDMADHKFRGLPGNEFPRKSLKIASIIDHSHRLLPVILNRTCCGKNYFRISGVGGVYPTWTTRNGAVRSQNRTMHVGQELDQLPSSLAKVGGANHPQHREIKWALSWEFSEYYQRNYYSSVKLTLANEV